MSKLTVRSGGFWLHQLGNVVGLSYTNVRDAGSGNGGGGRFYTCSWSMPTLAKGFTHPCFQRGSLVELFDSGYPKGCGVMSEPDRSEWKFTATGFSQEMDGYANTKVVSSVLTPTTVLNDVIDYHIANSGLRLTRPTSLSSTPFITIAGPGSTIVDDNLGLATFAAGIRTLADLLNAVAAKNGMRWWIDEFRQIRMDVDRTLPSTQPDWVLLPDVPQMGVADDDYVSGFVGLYASSMSAGVITATGVAVVSDSAAAARWGKKVKVIDLTPLGQLSLGAAQANLQARLDKTGARMGFTNRLEVDARHLQNFGGTPAYLKNVKDGHVLRIKGIEDLNGNLAFGLSTDIQINQVDFNQDNAASLTLAPMGLVVRSLSDFVSDATAPETVGE